MSTNGSQAEGEDAPDLVAFAKALKAKTGVAFYGAIWCPFCNEQKQLFQDGAQFLPFQEVTNPDRTPNALGQSKKHFHLSDMGSFLWDSSNGRADLATAFDFGGYPSRLRVGLPLPRFQLRPC